MGGEGFPIDIIIFAAIAAFIVLRLRSVLGRRTGNERPPAGTFGGPRRGADGDKKVVRLPERGSSEGLRDFAYEKAEPGSPLEAGLTEIKRADRSFNGDEFLAGARTAFEMIIEAFAAGRMDPVRTYLSDDVHQNFTRAIDAREDAGETLETTVVGISRADMIEARMEGRAALITVKFVSEQINVTRDKDGKVVDGDPDHVSDVTDIWTFSRDTRSKDPNWSLVDSRSSN